MREGEWAEVERERAGRIAGSDAGWGVFDQQRALLLRARPGALALLLGLWQLLSAGPLFALFTPAVFALIVCLVFF